MPRRFTMETLVTRCKQRADKENDDSISNAEWKALISESYGELYTAVAETGMQYFEYVATITTDGSDSYDEPDDHLATICLDRVIDAAGRRRTVREIMAQERSRWAGRSSGEALVFAYVDDQIYLYPTPPAGQTYELLYVPQSPDLSLYADADIVDVVCPAGEAFIIWHATIPALNKSESDVRLAMAQADRLLAKAEEWAINKALSQPRRRVIDDFDPSEVPVSDADWRFNR